MQRASGPEDTILNAAARDFQSISQFRPACRLRFHPVLAPPVSLGAAGGNLSGNGVHLAKKADKLPAHWV